MPNASHPTDVVTVGAILASNHEFSPSKQCGNMTQILQNSEVTPMSTITKSNDKIQAFTEDDRDSDAPGMRIAHISATGLFGIFDHDIQLNLDERITIMLGPNGVGKTAILSMADNLLNMRFSIFRRIPFKSFQMDFTESGTSLVIEDINKNLVGKATDAQSKLDLQVKYSQNGLHLRVYKIPPRDPNEQHSLSLSMIEEELPGLERVSSRMWRYHLTGELLNLDEVLDRFGDQLHPGLSDQRLPDWLQAIRRDVHVRLIETQRYWDYLATNSTAVELSIVPKAKRVTGQ